MTLLNWLNSFFGLDDGQGEHYLFWSGLGSDISEVAVLGAVYAIWRRHNCAVKGCWRVGHRQVPGTDHVVCRRHHPRPQPTHEELLAEHRRNTT